MREFLPKGRMFGWYAIMVMVGLILLFGFSDLCARTKDMSSASGGQSAYRSAKVSQVCIANMQQRVHRVNRAAFCLTNWGFFGSQTMDFNETKGGCFMPDPESETEEAESFNYPMGSPLEYLFQGALWIGAIMPAENPQEGNTLDTVVSTGHDGWAWIEEFFPDGPAPQGTIIERTIRPTVPNMDYVDACTSSEAVSEQDIISVYYDTSAEAPCSEWSPATEGPDYRHRPIGIEVTQKSYAWSYSYAEDFFLIDFWIKNMNLEDTIKDIYIGIYIDADVGWPKGEGGLGGSQDDIAGFLDTFPNPIDPSQIDTIATAWIADNDGFLETEEGTPPSAFHKHSCTSVTGVRVVRRPPAPENDTLQLYGEFFNWWLSSQTAGPRDWSPKTLENQERWKDLCAYNRCENTFPGGLRGTPDGDITKYFVMSNREWDYDQVYSDIEFEGWVERSSAGGDIADGFDTRYLFSFGPIYEIAPGDSVPLTIGYIAGENFHSKPYNCKKNLKDNYDPDEYMHNLDFSDFAINSQWAARVYDNPGVDTDGNGYAGEPIIDEATGDTLGYRTGDGVPDFAGPPPPFPPDLSFTVTEGQVTFSWNGRETEQGKDTFTGKQDFEGYRIYMGEVKLGAEYSLIHSADRIDFKLWKYNPLLATPKFVYKFPSVPAEYLKSWFWNGASLEEVFDSIKAHPDSISAWTYTGPDTTLEIGKNSDEKLEIESGDLFYFRQQDWNRGFAGIVKYPEYRDSVDQGLVTDTLDKYWDYEYTVSGLLPSRQVRFAVTAFDYGNPSTALEPLESSRSVNEFKAYPFASLEEVNSNNLKIVVYPNPYRGDGGYPEDTDGSGWRRETDRRLWFANLPEYCTIRIYTLDGDLVREIEHDGRNSSNPTMDYWNLISRNTQAVVSGIYLFSVEDNQTGENQVGKFVIIM